MGFTFFKAFVWVMFPPPAILAVLLLLPLPRGVTTAIVHLCDSILFMQPHPGIGLSLFWLCFGVSCFTFFASFNSILEKKEVYDSVKMSGGNTSPALIKLLAAERNAWISGTACCLWLFLHRFRHLMKRTMYLEEQVEAGGTTAGDSKKKK
uniref:BAP29/BAP31 transmembrane domain-containing protein n=1 Tax=Mucochytrium quahogii TaxID=96639 RepID=A0A7S2S677_9STRA|mmetsp:Transcript_29223/g.46972  ORF Transcript_29223/g.46972 Transcript_29223/m.46972 type:complete len:151 (-) Transcript_29223:386-838(-)